MATQIDQQTATQERHSNASTGMATATDTRRTPPNTLIWDAASGW